MGKIKDHNDILNYRFQDWGYEESTHSIQLQNLQTI